MSQIDIKTRSKSYPVIIEPGALGRSVQYLDSLQSGQRWIIVTQPPVNELYGQTLFSALRHHQFDVDILVLPKGEEAKNSRHLTGYMQQLVDLDCDRNSMLIALGGGVVGDVTGFLAAVYMRGMAFCQFPTTLLAMVDASVGGKTALNLPEGKNLIGAFHQPDLVLADPHCLVSLPRREINAALAEILKYGAIKEKEFFDQTAKNLVTLGELSDQDILSLTIQQSCQIKASIVGRDELDQGERLLLNFGHTIGHALEAAAGYSSLLHGEAVAYGMWCAGWISQHLGLLSADQWATLQKVLNGLTLPGLSGIDQSAVLQYIKRDKKMQRGVLRFVVLTQLGAAVIREDISADILDQAIAKLFQIDFEMP